MTGGEPGETDDPRPPPRFLALVGPTAVGKTALSLEVARRIDAEIVSVDSRQVYRGMDVGTAKPTEEERGGVPHHGLDLLNPDRRYSAGRFARDARRWIREIESRGRVPLLVGGTGFFLRALTDPIFREPAMDDDRRDRLRAWLGGRPEEELVRWVRRLDPERAAVAGRGGPQRLGRTLEVALLSGRPLSWWHRHGEPEAEPVAGVVCLLHRERDDLYDRIDRRVDAMVEGGLLDEVRALLERGFGPDDPGLSGTGYREIAAHLAGETSLDEAAERIGAATRGFARRQITWFRHQRPEPSMCVDAARPLEEQADRVVRAWREARAG